jgi:hypothetical protein
VQQAVLKAAQYVAQPTPDELNAKDQFGQPLKPESVDISGFIPKIRATFPSIPENPVVLEPGPFGAEIKAHLVWFPVSEALRLVPRLTGSRSLA